MTQIDCVLLRLMTVLIISQLSELFKQMFVGTVWSIIYVLVLLAGTIVFTYYLNIRQLISPENFPDEKVEPSNEIKAHWWNYYRHPLMLSNTTAISMRARADHSQSVNCSFS